MEYTRKTVFCKQSGLTEEQARISLLKHATIVGTEIGPLYEENGRWTASLFVPKVASPPFPPNNDNEESDSLPKPKDDSGESETSDEPDGDEGGVDSPPKPKAEGEGGDKHKSEGGGGKEGEILELLHILVDALAGPSMPPGPGAGAPSPHPAPPGPGGPPGGPMGAGGPPPGPPGAGGPPGGPHVQEVIHKRVLKPGEAPPGTLPVGAPALSHTIPIAQLQHLTGLTDGRNITLSQATADLDKKFSSHGFKVAQIKRLNDGSEKIAALLTKR